jgi:hypothetical protein
MFFCPNCDNTFDITRTVPTLQNNPAQQGGKKADDNILSTSSEISVSDSSDSMIQSSKSKGSSTNVLIQRALDNLLNKDDLKDVTLDSIIKDPEYKKLSFKHKELVYNKIRDILEIGKAELLEKNDDTKQANMAYFLCKNCGYNEPIKEGTLIFSRSTENTNKSMAFDDINYINDPTLPLTRNYVCPNNKCESHKNAEQREAVFYRLPHSYKVRYICKTCHTPF